MFGNLIMFCLGKSATFDRIEGLMGRGIKFVDLDLDQVIGDRATSSFRVFVIFRLKDNKIR